MRATSALACESVTPGFKRARAWKSNTTVTFARSSRIGSSKAGLLRRNLNEAGSTPMISAGVPSTSSGLTYDVLGAAELSLPVAI